MMSKDETKYKKTPDKRREEMTQDEIKDSRQKKEEVKEKRRQER